VSEKEINTEVHLIKEYAVSPVIVMKDEVKVSDLEKSPVLSAAAAI
jgi:hypothetical protein